MFRQRLQECRDDILYFSMWALGFFGPFLSTIIIFVTRQLQTPLSRYSLAQLPPRSFVPVSEIQNSYQRDFS
ncbi:hypothetical protein L2E82_17676 [Cichorium intybus]|uniref:Uncharacterized protein n=1 Tax=Cichorium intybus TaxID=13427 RepID=A0ACB9F8S5_CICIN|nr:hypothetical protein L2E82_17676 [Cichorium intybus]